MLGLSVVMQFYCIDWTACYQLPQALRPLLSLPHIWQHRTSLHEIGSKHIPSYFEFRIVFLIIMSSMNLILVSPVDGIKECCTCLPSLSCCCPWNRVNLFLFH